MKFKYASILFISVLAFVSALSNLNKDVEGPSSLEMVGGKKAVICTSVANFYKKIPKKELYGKDFSLRSPVFSDKSSLDTQLLFGEKISVLRLEGEWVKIKAMEQLFYDEERHAFVPKEGYIKKFDVYGKESFFYVEEYPEYNCVISFPFVHISGVDNKPTGLILSLGSKFYAKINEAAQEKGIDEVLVFLGNRLFGKTRPVHLRSLSLLKNYSVVKKRELIIKSTLQFWGGRYVWGGRSACQLRHFSGREILGGVDCSGFVNLLYRMVGIDIPRDAYCQYKKCVPIIGKELQDGDLVFYKRNAASKISHVMLFDKSTFGDAVLMAFDGDFEGFCAVKIKRFFGVDLSHLNSYIWEVKNDPGDDKFIRDGIYMFGRILEN